MSIRIIRAIFCSLFLGVVGLFAFYIGGEAYFNRNIVYPTLDTKSAFLRDYNPQAAVAAFQADGSSGWGSSIGSSPGEGCVNSRSDFKGSFTIPAQASESLIINVKNDVLAHLHGDGATISRRSGDPTHGYHLDYSLGNRSGWVAIPPLKAARWVGYVPEGAVPVALDLTISETYCPKSRSSDQPAPKSF